MKTEIHLGRWRTDLRNDCPNEDNDDECNPFIKIPISTVTTHDKYKPSTEIIGGASVKMTKDDIALVKLLWAIQYKYNVKPVCLPIKDDIPSFSSVDVSGFGINLIIYVSAIS